MTNKCAVIILAAGMGTRLKSAMPKVLHQLAGKSLVHYVIDTAKTIKPDNITVVVGHAADQVTSAVAPLKTTLQSPQQGTGHAVQCAMPALKNIKGDVVVVYGDTPLLTAETLKEMLKVKKQKRHTLVMLGFVAKNPTGYGRFIVQKDQLFEIVEQADATPQQREITLCNSGVLVMGADDLRKFLPKLSNKNKKREYYLTDLVSLAVAAKKTCGFVVADEDEVLGINTRAELAIAENILQNKLRNQAMHNGVTMIDPSTVYLSADTKFGTDVIIEPSVFFGPGVTVGSNTTIKAFSHIEGAKIGSGVSIGPFARIRPATKIEDNAKLGNFIEIKKSTIKKGAKVQHLSYVGDAIVGGKANIGAGTITCNYDGVNKYQTVIGDNAFIGSNTSLIAPIKIGKNAKVGAGSVITQNVGDNELGIARVQQVNKKKKDKK